VPWPRNIDERWWALLGAVVLTALYWAHEHRSRSSRLDPRLAQQVEADMRKAESTEDSFSFTEEHLAVLRTAVVAWDDCEAGAPRIERFTETALAARMSPFDIDNALAIVLKFGELAPGLYSYDDPRAQALGVDAGAPKRISVELTGDHLRLLHGAHVDGAGIDAKRPYGDMTCFYIDMARLLDVAPEGKSDGCEGRFSTTQRERFDAIHSSMPRALEAYLRHVRRAPARFARWPAGFGRWREVK
jgi:hypothetical protein